MGSEVERPERTIPLSLILGVSLTASLYLLLNAVYIYAMPVPQMRGVIAIAKEASGVLFSPAAAGACARVAESLRAAVASATDSKSQSCFVFMSPV